jgi:dTDP-4-dehydrorhamnose 3,5-epimerase
MDFHRSVQAASRDSATVTKAGLLLASSIEGVKVHGPVNHVDNRGRLFEVYPGPNDYWTEPVVYCYTFTVRANQVKGWGLHQKKIDRYTLITGELTTLLFDARADSPTAGQSQTVTLSGEGARQLTIPRGVWHMNINVSPTETYLINHPSEIYEHANPDRLLLPWNTSEIPVDVAAMFPVQFSGAADCPCE